MNEMADVEVVLSLNAYLRSTERVEVHTLTTSERGISFLKTLGLWWGIALGSVFIPILHLILVPTSLLVGGILSIRRLSLNQQIVAGRALCPQCQKDLVISKAPFAWPKRIQCVGCTELVLIRPLKN